MSIRRSLFVLTVVCAAFLFFSSLTQPAEALTPLKRVGDFTQVLWSGYDNPNNAYVLDTVEFNGYLYMGTICSPASQMYSGSSDSGGEIWRSKDGAEWERVGSPGLGNTKNFAIHLSRFKNRLYAATINGEEGLEIWASSDGQSFEKMASGGFGDKENTDPSIPLVFKDRLIVCTSNVKNGMEIWVSTDGKKFDRVVQGGLGDTGNTGSSVMSYDETGVTFQGRLYVGTSNPNKGGEIWRTEDGLQWERVASGGLGNVENTSLTPNLVFQGQLYAESMNTKGMDVFRSSDGTNWERVVENGFGRGENNNIYGFLTQFQGNLYLVAENADPRVLTQPPSERFAPRGFELWRSADGKDWTQVGEPGFGNDNNTVADISEDLGGALYLSTANYKDGVELWTSTDGEKWDRIFKDDSPSLYNEGGGPLSFQDRVYLEINDLKNGVSIWRSEPIAGLAVEAKPTAPGASSTSPEATPESQLVTPVSPGESGLTVEGATPTATPVPAASTSSGSDAWPLAVSIVGGLAVLGGAGVGIMLVRSRGGTTQKPVSGQKYCPKCGQPLGEDAEFCSRCGQRQ
jgi:hypothetical protein